MMLPFVLLLLPCLIVADTQCPGGEVSCPEGKACCTVEGQTSCCDTDAKLPMRSVLLTETHHSDAKSEDVLLNSTMYSSCNFMTCPGTCCNSGSYGCCPIKMATCCSNDKCCESLNTCCGSGCCPFMSKCCGSWCCKSNQRCGISYMTCFNGAATLVPALASLLAVWFAVAVVSKL